MVIQIRGICGTGKSTAVRQLLREHVVVRHPVEEITFLGKNKGKDVVRRADVWECSGGLYVLGKYDLDDPVVRGKGGDVVSGPGGRAALLEFARRPDVRHVLWEGLFASTSLPRDPWLGEMKSLGYIWAVPNTTADECVARVIQRQIDRETKNPKPPDPDEYRQKHAALHELCDRASREFGVPVFELDAFRIYEDLHELLIGQGWECGHEVAATGQTITVSFDDPLDSGRFHQALHEQGIALEQVALVAGFNGRPSRETFASSQHDATVQALVAEHGGKVES